MNRLDELNEFLNEINDNIPEELNTIEKKFRKKVVKRNINRFITVPICCLLTIAIAFTCMINFVPSFAYACSNIPIISDIAEMINFSPSLERAYNNQYIQRIDLTKTINDFTVNLKYAMVDEDELNIFYTIESDKYEDYCETPQLYFCNKKFWNGCGKRYGYLSKNDIQVINSNISKLDIPLEEKLNDINICFDIALSSDDIENENYIAQFDFNFSLDPNKIAKSKYINLDKKVKIGEQEITISYVKISPSNTKIAIKEDENNTATLSNIELCIKDNKKNIYDSNNGGISTVSIKYSDNPLTYYFLASPYFTNYKSLKLCIGGAQWLDKDNDKMKLDLLDLSNNDFYCYDCKLIEAVKVDNNYILAFDYNYCKDNAYKSLSFSGAYYDENGKEYQYNSKTYYQNDYYMRSEQKSIDLEECHEVIVIELENYKYDTVYFPNQVTSITEFKKPIEINLK